MDAALSVALQISEDESWGGHTRPHDLTWVLSLTLPLLPLDARARAACVCRAWRAAASAPALWGELSFERCTVYVSNEDLAALCARAGAGLRALSLDANACYYVTCAGMLAALRDGGCTGLRRLWGPRHNQRIVAFERHDVLTAELAQQLTATCPLLELAAFFARCGPLEAAAVVTALPGPLKLACEGFSDTGATRLAECLRGNYTLTDLNLTMNLIGDSAATQLAECLRVNATLTSLNLAENGIGYVGVMQLAACLRVNATLTSLNLKFNNINCAGATQLAESLHVNTVLTNLNLSGNGISDAGALQLAECLRVNAALTSLNLSVNLIGDAGATQLAECLRVNTTLRCLNLRSNDIGNLGFTHVAECLRFNATLTSLYLSANNLSDVAVLRALHAACPPQCKLHV